MHRKKFTQWSRTVETMRMLAGRDKGQEMHGVDAISCQDTAWKLKKQAVLAILDQLCNLLKEEDKNSFFCQYWALKTYGTICMSFKDMNEAYLVFRRLKHECQDK